MIYFDNAATTFPKPNSVYEMVDYSSRHAFNAGRGSYRQAQESTRIINETRSKILSLNNFKSGNVVFSTSATEALNNIIFGVELQNNSNIYVSPFEHNSIIRPLYELSKRKNIKVHILPFNKETWEVNEDEMNNMFALNKPHMIFLSHVSNVTGYILPYTKIFELGKKYNAITVLDSSQGYGVVPINDNKYIDFIVFAGHKSLYATFGVAGFINLTNVVIKPTIFGGTGSDTMNPEMGNIVEVGSSNIIAISSLNTSIDWLKTNNIFNHEKELTNYLVERLREIKKCVIYLPQNINTMVGIVSINIQGYSAGDVGTILDDEFNICVRTGYHCAPYIHEFIDSIKYSGTVRVSLSYFSTKEEINDLVNALKSL